MLPFFALVLGLFEGSLLLGNSLAVSHSTKAGARTASALGADLMTDFQVLSSIGRESRALNRNDFNFIVVYKADAFGAEPPATC